jgi:hypothetical protein
MNYVNTCIYETMNTSIFHAPCKAPGFATIFMVLVQGVAQWSRAWEIDTFWDPSIYWCVHICCNQQIVYLSIYCYRLVHTSTRTVCTDASMFQYIIVYEGIPVFTTVYCSICMFIPVYAITGKCIAVPRAMPRAMPAWSSLIKTGPWLVYFKPFLSYW